MTTRRAVGTRPLIRGAVGVAAVAFVGVGAAGQDARFVDATAALGLDGVATGRCKFADLNGDGKPDVIASPGNGQLPVVFLNRFPEPFERLAGTGLPTLARGDLIVFADMDNDGNADAIVTRYVEDPEARSERTAVYPGAGDGTFGAPVAIDGAQAATTCAIAVGDVDLDGRLDLYLGHWYRAYGKSLEGFENDLLLADGDGAFSFERAGPMYDSAGDDAGGRPTYGAVLFDTRDAQAIADWDDLMIAETARELGDRPDWSAGGFGLLELNYGRRWNRLWRSAAGDGVWRVDPATARGIDGDRVRHGRHPDWLKERAKTDARFDRKDEAPFRSNGNTFDAAIGDVDGDGDLDLFLAEITHAWAGDSSDRSRFLLSVLRGTGRLGFTSAEKLSVDRIPSGAEAGDLKRWNQGDIFCALADFDHDGRLDLLLCSSDYPDPPPFDERLRVYLQQPDGTFADRTAELGIDHIGAGQPSLADVDGDGDLDILVGQSFNRMTPELRRHAGLANGSITERSGADAKPRPRMRLLLNEATGERNSVVLRLRGDGAAVTRDALGALVRCTARLSDDPGAPEVTQTRSLVGVGGHAGKQDDFIVHFGVGDAAGPVEVEILWPGRRNPAITKVVVAPGGVLTIERPAKGR